MPWRKCLVAGPLLLALGLGACGSGSGGAPTDASKASFCRTFQGARRVAAPHRLGAHLARVGTPAGISASARHGFEVLVERLGALPAHADKGDLSQMSKSLTGTDQRDVVAFITYYASECHGLPSGFSS
jgi:hypothetical protein